MEPDARQLGMFPLSTVLFPYARLPLHVFEPRYLALTADCIKDGGRGEFGVVLITRGSEVGGGDQRSDVGTVARIVDGSSLPGNRLSLMTEGTRRIRVVEWLPDEPYPRARVEELGPGGSPVPPAALDAATGAVRRVRALLSELGAAPALPHELGLGETEEEVLWRLCGLAPLSSYDAQRLLVVEDQGHRARELATLCDAISEDATRMLAGGADAGGSAGNEPF